jgi:hypothetical protein
MGIITSKKEAACLQQTAEKTRSAKHHTLSAVRSQDNSLKKIAGKNGH